MAETIFYKLLLKNIIIINNYKKCLKCLEFDKNIGIAYIILNVSINIENRLFI